MFDNLVLLYIPPSGGSPIPPTPGIEPNPDETVWTLGTGGAVVSPAVAPGFSVTLATVLLNNGVPLSYTSSATLDASVWPGGNEPASFSPSVAWITPASATLTLVITAAQSASVDQGKYRMQVGVTVSGVRSLAYDGWLLVGSEPGSTAYFQPWATVEDMRLSSTTIDTLLNKQADITNFLGQLVEASLEILRWIVLRYNPRPGYTLVRMNVPDIISGLDVAMPGAVPIGKYLLTQCLNTVGGIVLEAKLRRMVAKYAIALVLRRQATGGNAEVYRKEADACMQWVLDTFEDYQAIIYSATPVVSPSPIGAIQNFLIDADCVLLPSGTSP